MADGFDYRPRNSFERFLFNRDDGLMTLVEAADAKLLGHIVLDKTNKNISFLKTEDLECAIACIQVMKENQTYHGEKIGVIRKPINGINQFKQGEIVVYREGEHLEGDDTKTLVVESPMTAERIQENREQGSLITTHKTTVCVPREYVMDVNQS